MHTYTSRLGPPPVIITTPQPWTISWSEAPDETGEWTQEAADLISLGWDHRGADQPDPGVDLCTIEIHDEALVHIDGEPATAEQYGAALEHGMRILITDHLNRLKQQADRRSDGTDFDGPDQTYPPHTD